MKVSKPFDDVLGKTKDGETVSYSKVSKLIAVGNRAIGCTQNEVADIGFWNEDNKKLKSAIDTFNSYSYVKHSL